MESGGGFVHGTAPQFQKAFGKQLQEISKVIDEKLFDGDLSEFAVASAKRSEAVSYYNGLYKSDSFNKMGEGEVDGDKINVFKKIEEIQEEEKTAYDEAYKNARDSKQRAKVASLFNRSIYGSKFDLEETKLRKIAKSTRLNIATAADKMNQQLANPEITASDASVIFSRSMNIINASREVVGTAEAGRQAQVAKKAYADSAYRRVEENGTLENEEKILDLSVHWTDGEKDRLKAELKNAKTEFVTTFFDKKAVPAMKKALEMAKDNPAAANQYLINLHASLGDEENLPFGMRERYTELMGQTVSAIAAEHVVKNYSLDHPTDIDMNIAQVHLFAQENIEAILGKGAKVSQQANDTVSFKFKKGVKDGTLFYRTRQFQDAIKRGDFDAANKMIYKANKAQKTPHKEAQTRLLTPEEYKAYAEKFRTPKDPATFKKMILDLYKRTGSAPGSRAHVSEKLGLMADRPELRAFAQLSDRNLAAVLERYRPVESLDEVIKRDPRWTKHIDEDDHKTFLSAFHENMNDFFKDRDTSLDTEMRNSMREMSVGVAAHIMHTQGPMPVETLQKKVRAFLGSLESHVKVPRDADKSLVDKFWDLF